MDHARKRSIAAMFRSLGSEIGLELFVAGVLSVVLGLVLVRTALPAPVLPLIGLAAFLAFLFCGRALAKKRGDPRWFDIPAWGIVGFLAIVWIAAGRLIGLDRIEQWLP